MSDGTEAWTVNYSSPFGALTAEVALDSGGNVYLTGYELTSNNDHVGFVVKYDSAGNEVWKRYAVHDVSPLDHPYSGDGLYAVVADSAGSIFVVGSTDGEYVGNSNAGGDDVLIRKINSETGDTVWTRQFGTAGGDYAYGVALDYMGGVYVVSQFGDGLNASIARFDADGNQYWNKQFDSISWSRIAADAAGAYVAGSINDDAIVKKFDLNGEDLGTVTIGSLDHDEAYGVAVAPSGAVYVAGNTWGDLRPPCRRRVPWTFL